MRFNENMTNAEKMKMYEGGGGLEGKVK